MNQDTRHRRIRSFCPAAFLCTACQQRPDIALRFPSKRSIILMIGLNLNSEVRKGTGVRIRILAVSYRQGRRNGMVDCRVPGLGIDETRQIRTAAAGLWPGGRVWRGTRSYRSAPGGPGGVPPGHGRPQGGARQAGRVILESNRGSPTAGDPDGTGSVHPTTASAGVESDL